MKFKKQTYLKKNNSFLKNYSSRKNYSLKIINSKKKINDLRNNKSKKRIKYIVNTINRHKKNIKKIFVPILRPYIGNTEIIKKNINFIKKNIKYKKSTNNDNDNDNNNNNNDNNEKIFNKYKIYLTLSDDNFNTLINNNYEKGKQSIKNIINSEKYMLSFHGKIVTSIFQLPDNINIIFISPIRYMTCLKFNNIKMKNKIISSLDNYLQNAHCIKNLTSLSIFSESVIYYGGQYCIDLLLQRSNHSNECVTGIHYINKNENNEYTTTEDGIKYNNVEFNNTLSNLLKTDFYDTSQNYTILVLSCRESHHLDALEEDILVFYEQLLKRLNFKINYENTYEYKNNKNNNKNNNINNNKNNNINNKYNKCKTKKIHMNKNVFHSQFIRLNSSKKGKIQSRNNAIININSTLINKTGVEISINELKTMIDNVVKDDFKNDLELYKILFNILNINKIDVNNLNTIIIDNKKKINIIKIIFGDQYELMFTFLVYCQCQLNTLSKIFFLEYCFKYIKELQSITNIYINNMNINFNKNLLVFIINKFAYTVTILDISFNNIDFYSVKYIVSVLKVNKTLTELYINNNNIGAVGATVLADALKFNTTLTTLDISDNNIVASGATALAEALKDNKTLTTLVIINNNIGNNGTVSLAEAFKVNRSITILYISSNKIGDIGATALAEALKVNKSLRTLDISKNGIGINGAIALENALKVNVTLLEFDINYNNIKNDVVIALQRFIPS